MFRITLCDNSIANKAMTEQQIASLAAYAGVSLKKLHEWKKNLLIFPHCLGAHCDGISKQTLFDIVGGKLKTGNVMGFFSIADIEIAIHSRFDHSNKQFFLHYMLQKIFGINILSLKTNQGSDELWEFYIYLFPACLLQALKQGLFRAYRRYECNDNKVRGAINIAAHLKQNLPFAGKIATRVREYSTDNPMLQLIRHTIEFINGCKQRSAILVYDNEIRSAVAQIVAATPSYNVQSREKIISLNLRKNTHPYFTEYSFLQNLCLKILRYDKISTGRDADQINGIVFDGAWLWEEYLATVLKKLGFEHPENKTGKNRRYLFQDQSGWIYPDFIGKNAVLDAKYKMLDESYGSREDRFQIISYMHVLNKNNGFLIYPDSQNIACTKNKALNGLGGQLGTIPFLIQTAETWNEFTKLMCMSEDTFRNNLKKCTLES